MTSSVVLLLYAVAMSAVGPRLVARSRWLRTAPGLHVFAWQVVTGSVIGSLLLAGLALTLRLTLVEHPSAGELCLWTLRTLTDPRREGMVILTSSVLLALMLARLVSTSWRIARRERSQRTRARTVLDLVSLPEVSREGVVVIEHEVAFAFCIPGRHHRVVVTTGLLEHFDAAQIDAVLAHEAGHIRQRHHLALWFARSAEEAFGSFLPWLRTAHEETACCLELCADDFARRRVGALPLSRALSAMTSISVGPALLAAAGDGVGRRIDRLSSGVTKAPLPAWFGLALGAAFLTAVSPLLAGAAMAGSDLWRHLC